MKRILRTLLGIDDSPHHIALSFSLGVFFGFSPLLGLHAILGLAFAFFFRLNKAAVLIGVYSNQPWIMIPYYGFATWVGVQISGLEETLEFPEVALRELLRKDFWLWLFEQHWLLLPAFVGSFLLCTILALITYALTLQIVKRLRRARPAVKFAGKGKE